MVIDNDKIELILSKLERYRVEAYEVRHSDIIGLTYIEDKEGGLIFVEDLIKILKEL